MAPPRSPLAGLDAVPWGTLFDAEGPADAVPDILRDLVSDDPDVRAGAYYDGVLSRLWHQGTIFEASAAAAPFLVALLADEHTPARGRLAVGLLLLAQAARNAVGRPHLERAPKDSAGRERDGRALLDALGREAKWLLDVYVRSPELAPLAALTMVVVADDPDTLVDRFAAAGAPAPLLADLREAAQDPTGDTTWSLFERYSEGMEEDLEG